MVTEVELIRRITLNWHKIHGHILKKSIFCSALKMILVRDNAMVSAFHRPEDFYLKWMEVFCGHSVHLWFFTIIIISMDVLITSYLKLLNLDQSYIANHDQPW